MNGVLKPCGASVPNFQEISISWIFVFKCPELMQKYKMKKGNTQNVSIDQILPASLSSSKQFILLRYWINYCSKKNEPEFIKYIVCVHVCICVFTLKSGSRCFIGKRVPGKRMA